MRQATVKNGLKYALVIGGVLAVAPTAHAQGIGERTLDRMTMGTPQQIERGAEVYDEQCAECHGEEGTEPTALGQQMGAPPFATAGELERSGIYSIYDVVTRGYDYDDRQHPAFQNLRYQDRWAVSHYTHDLVDDPQPDPDELVARVREQARNGICNPDVRQEVDQFAEPQGQEQIDQGAEEFSQRCTACHGEDGRGVTPDARDFHAPVDDWVRGSSPFAIYETLQQGVEGTAMASFAHLPDDTLWSLVHYVRQELVPEENLEEVTEEEILSVCRSMSAPAPPEPISVERAMDFLADDADEQRYVRLMGYGPPLIHEDADPQRGRQLYEQNCVGCHGADGNPEDAIGPYGKFPPYLTIQPRPLEPASAGGTYRKFAERVVSNVHVSLPDHPTVATYNDRDWKDLQAWMATLEGEHGIGRDRIRTVQDLEEARQYLEQIDDTPDQQADEVDETGEDGDAGEGDDTETEGDEPETQNGQADDGDADTDGGETGDNGA